MNPAPITMLEHAIVVPTDAGRFIFDTGIGLTLISDCAGCAATGEFTGRRMSGQALTIGTGTLPALTVAGHTERDVPVGIMDLAAMLPPEWEIAGVLSLQFFRETPVTIDYAGATLTVETRDLGDGHPVDVTVERDGPSLGVMLPMTLGEEMLSMEVDTGSDILILHTRYMDVLGVDVEAEDVEQVRGTDETGHEYLRTFATIAGPVGLPGAPDFAQRDLRVMFQDIIYDGLVGRDFLSRFRVTYDLARARMIFGAIGGS